MDGRSSVVDVASHEGTVTRFLHAVGMTSAPQERLAGVLAFGGVFKSAPRVHAD